MDVILPPMVEEMFPRLLTDEFFTGLYGLNHLSTQDFIHDEIPRIVSNSHRKRPRPEDWYHDLNPKRIRLIDPLRDDKKAASRFHIRREQQMMKFAQEALHDPTDEQSQWKIKMFENYMKSVGQHEAPLTQDILKRFSIRQWLAKDTIHKWRAAEAFLNPLDISAEDEIDEWTMFLKSAGLETEASDLIRGFEKNLKWARLLDTAEQSKSIQMLVMKPWLPDSKMDYESIIDGERDLTKAHVEIIKRYQFNLDIYHALEKKPELLYEGLVFFGKADPIPEDRLTELWTRLSPMVTLNAFLEVAAGNHGTYKEWIKLNEQIEEIEAYLNPLLPRSKEFVEQRVAKLLDQNRIVETQVHYKMYQDNLAMANVRERLAKLAHLGKLEI